MLLAFPGWGPQSWLLILVYFVYVIKHPGWSSTSTSKAGGRLGGAQGRHPEGVWLQALCPLGREREPRASASPFSAILLSIPLLLW